MLTVLVLSHEHLLYGEKVYLFICIKKYFKIHILLHLGYKHDISLTMFNIIQKDFASEE
jgi:hypothetical protein